LRDGRLSSAASSDFDLRLGQRLLDEYALSHADLAHALSLQEQIAYDAPLGSIIVLLGLTEHATVERTIHEQIMTNLVRLLLNSGGKFRFKRGTPEVRGVRIDLPIEREVLRAIHRADGWAAVTSPAATLRLRCDVTADELVPIVVPTWPVIDAMLDGATTITEIAASTGWTMERTIALMCRLLNDQIVSIGPSITDGAILPPVSALPSASWRVSS